jgi:hypothetical protein
MKRVTAAAILCCAGCASYFSSTPDPETISPPTRRVIVPLPRPGDPDSSPSTAPKPVSAPASTPTSSAGT